MIAAVVLLGCSSTVAPPERLPRGGAGGATVDDAGSIEGVGSTPSSSGSQFPPPQSADASVIPLAAGTICHELTADHPDICSDWAPHVYDCYPNQSLPKGLDALRDCYRFADIIGPDDWKCCPR